MPAGRKAVRGAVGKAVGIVAVSWIEADVIPDFSLCSDANFTSCVCSFFLALCIPGLSLDITLLLLAVSGILIGWYLVSPSPWHQLQTHQCFSTALKNFNEHFANQDLANSSCPVG